MNLRRFLGKCLAGWFMIRSKIQPSFSQSGEDQVIRFLFFSCLQNETPTYLDIGTNHPFICNNTFYFYNRGSKGVCVEPDERFDKLIRKHRSRDIFLPIGVGTSSSADSSFFIFPSPYSGWNTFSRAEAEKRQLESGIKFECVEKMPLMGINEIIAKYFDPYPNLISIDVEGLDLEILKSMNFDAYRPEVICVESIDFSVTNQGKKINEIAEFVTSKGYFVFADTHVNTIFCRKDAFEKGIK